MAYTKEQNKQFADYLTKQGKTSATATREDAQAFIKSTAPLPVQKSREDIMKETGEKIKTWNFTAQDTRAYNLASWNQQWAREVMLWSNQAMNNQNVKTSVTADEASTMNNAWIKSVWKNITADLQWWTKQDYAETVKTGATTGEIWKALEDKTITLKEFNSMTGSSKPTTTTDITYNKDKIPYNPKDVISKAEQFTWVDWKTYQTVRNSDNTLTTIDVTTWQPVTSKYTDTERDSIKQGLLWWTPQDLELKKQQEELLKQQQDPDVMFNTLVAGWIIDKSSPNYTAVNKRFQDYNTYKNYSENQMKTALKDWTIMSWTTAYNDLIKDPVTKLKIDKANILNMVNNENLDINKALDNKSTEILNTSVTVNWQETTIWKAMEDWYITQEEYNSMTSNSKITAKEQEAEDLKNSADELQNIYDWIKLDVENQFKWTWATRSEIQSIIWQRQENMLWGLNLAINKYNNAIWTLAQMKDDSTKLFATNLWQYNKQELRDYNAQLLADSRAYTEWQTAEQRAYNEELQTKQLEQQYQYEYWDLNSDNLTLQNIAIKNALTDMYTKYKDIPWMESMALKEQKVQDLISGKTTWTPMSWSQAIAQVESEIRWSKRYTNMLETKQAEWTWYQEFWWDLYKKDAKWNLSLAITWKADAWDWKKLDDWTYINPQWEIVTKQELDQQKLLSNNYLNAEIWSNTWLECGWYAIRWVWLTSVPWWNSLTDRKTSFTDTDAIPWWLVLFTWWNYDKTYWHIAIITWVNPDKWTITIKESNLKWDKKVTERIINANANTISWYYNNTPLAWWWKDETITDKQFTQFNQMYSKFVWDPQVKAFESALSWWWDLLASLKSSNWPWDVWAVFNFMKTLDPASTVREWEFALAAKSAWVWESFKNIPANKLEWTILTEKQRKDFWKLAFEYVKNKWKSYDIKYNDMSKILKNQWIPESYMPTRMTDYIKEYENTWTTTPTKSWTPLTTTWKSWTTYTFTPKQP